MTVTTAGDAPSRSDRTPPAGRPANPNPAQLLRPIAGPQTSVLIADQLREIILDGVFRPGEQVGEASLAGRLQVSRGPVREALQRLAQEGLVVSRRNRGVFVVELTPSDVEEVYAVRSAVELAAAEHLVRLPASDRGAVADRLRAVLDRMPAHVHAGDWPAATRVDLAFHSTFVAETGNRRLSRTYTTLAAESRICMVNLEHAYLRPETLPQEHHRLVDLLVDGDGHALAAAIRAHLSTAVDDLRQLMGGRYADSRSGHRTAVGRGHRGDTPPTPTQEHPHR